MNNAFGVNPCMIIVGGCTDISPVTRFGTWAPMVKCKKPVPFAKRSKNCGNGSFFKRIFDPERRKKCILESAIRMSRFEKLHLLGWLRVEKTQPPRVPFCNRSLGPTPDREALPFKLEILCKNASSALSWFGPKRIRR